MSQTLSYLQNNTTIAEESNFIKGDFNNKDVVSLDQFAADDLRNS
jgi:hypothetical protein